MSLIKLVVLLLLLAIIGSMASGLFFLITDKGKTDRTVRSLTLRIALSLVAFLILIVGAATGVITPHGVTP